MIAECLYCGAGIIIPDNTKRRTIKCACCDREYGVEDDPIDGKCLVCLDEGIAQELNFGGEEDDY